MAGAEGTEDTRDGKDTREEEGGYDERVDCSEGEGGGRGAGRECGAGVEEHDEVAAGDSEFAGGRKGKKRKGKRPGGVRERCERESSWLDRTGIISCRNGHDGKRARRGGERAFNRDQIGDGRSKWRRCAVGSRLCKLDGRGGAVTSSSGWCFPGRRWLARWLFASSRGGNGGGGVLRVHGDSQVTRFHLVRALLRLSAVRRCHHGCGQARMPDVSASCR